MDYSNILGGLRVQTQIPLDAKSYIDSEAKLKDLGREDNLAFVYQKGLIVYSILEENRWEWREVKSGEENTGLLDVDFVYPEDVINYGIDYSLKSYNFYPYVTGGEKGDKGDTGASGIDGTDGLNGEIGPKGDQGDRGEKGQAGEKGSTGLSAYQVALTDGFIGNENQWLLSLKGIKGDEGLQGPRGEDASNNLQKSISSNYTLKDEDNNYTILIDNSIADITIFVPDGLMNNFCAGFIQQGRKIVTFTHSGTGNIRTPTGLKMKGLNYNAYIEQIGTTNSFHLIGALIT